MEFIMSFCKVFGVLSRKWFCDKCLEVERRIIGILIFFVILSIYFLVSLNIVFSFWFFDELGVMVSCLLFFCYIDGYVYDFVFVIDLFIVIILFFFMYL